ncbi:MAG: deoxycytidylate deaminase, partial [Paraclostridium sp.]
MKKNKINFEEMFMGVAELVALRSKDPSQQVGACIVKDNKIISTGYNGMPYTVEAIDNDLIYPWTKGNKEFHENK